MGKLGGLIKTQLVKNKKKRKPDPRVWIFSSTDNSHYNYNSRYLFEYVRVELPEITPYFVINDDQLRRKLSEQYGEKYFIETNSGQGIQKVLEAGVWFTSAPRIAGIWYPSEQGQSDRESVAWDSPEKNSIDGSQPW